VKLGLARFLFISFLFVSLNEESPAVFAENFEMLRVFKEMHLTPSGSEQSFVFAVMRRK